MGEQLTVVALCVIAAIALAGLYKSWNKEVDDMCYGSSSRMPTTGCGDSVEMRIAHLQQKVAELSCDVAKMKEAAADEYVYDLTERDVSSDALVYVRTTKCLGEALEWYKGIRNFYVKRKV